MKCLQGHAMYDMYGTSVFCFHFIINSAGFEKNSVVFFSFVVRFRLVILFYSYFSICWLDFFPNIRFSNRSDYSIALSLSLRVIWSFLVVRIACFTWKTFLCLNCSVFACPPRKEHNHVRIYLLHLPDSWFYLCDGFDFLIAWQWVQS